MKYLESSGQVMPESSLVQFALEYKELLSRIQHDAGGIEFNARITRRISGTSTRGSINYCCSTSLCISQVSLRQLLIVYLASNILVGYHSNVEAN